MLNVTLQQWYAVRTKPQREDKANKDLRHVGFRTFYPLQRMRRLRARPHGCAAEWVTRPLFPSWLFIDSARDALHRALALDAVAGVASMDNEPVAIPAHVMSALTARADAAGVISKVVFKEGEQVQINFGGSLAELVGLVIKDDGGAHVRVLGKLLGSDREMLVPVELLKR